MLRSPARILEALEAAGVEIDARAFADAVWLASHRFFPPAAPRPPKPEIGAPRNAGESASTSDTRDPTFRAGADSAMGGAQPRMDAAGASRSGGLPETRKVPVSAPAAGRSGGGPGGGGSESIPLLAPAGRALPGARQISRALRPFNRRVPAREHWQLDEEATVRRYAEDRLWLPVLRPARARWLEVALVVDTAPSMLLWQPVLREFRWLLERQGAFRDVREWHLDTMGARPFLRRGRHPVARRPEELVDPAGRRLILLASDCVAPAWRNPEFFQWLRLWGRHQPVAIVQMLPARLWAATGLGGLSAVRLEAREPGLPNTRLHPVARRRGPARRPPAGVSIPVVPLDPTPIRDWAAMIAGEGFRPAAAYSFPMGGPEADPVEEPSPAEESPDVAIARFRAESSSESETAFRLACLLAAAPLRLPVMRLVQQVMLPGSTQGHLAEVFLSGLIQRVTPENAAVGPDDLDFEFRPGVRERLLSASYASESLGVLRAVSRYFDEHLGTGLGFEALLADPTGPGLESIPPGPGRVFARVSAEVLGRMGRRYAEAARRLAEAAQPWGRADLESAPKRPPKSQTEDAPPRPLEPDRWRELFDQGLRIADEATRGQALQDLARQALDHGPATLALEIIRSAIAIWEKRADQVQVGHSRWLEARALDQSGQVAESSRAYLAAVATLDRADYRAAGQAAAEYAGVLFRRGELREAEWMYRRAATRFDAVKDVQSASHVRLAMARVCVALGRLDEARSLAEYVIREFAEVGHRAGQAVAEQLLAELEAGTAASELSSQSGEPATDRSAELTLVDARVRFVRVLAAIAAKRRANEVPVRGGHATGAPQGRPRRGLAGATILWVDNRPQNNQREVEIFAARGARVIQVTGSHEALRRLSEGGVDVILSDMGRPEGNLAGLQLLDSVRERGFFQPFAIYGGMLAELYQDAVIARLGVISTSQFDRVLEALESALDAEPPQPACLPRERVDHLAKRIQGWGGDPEWARELDRDPGRSEVWTKLWETIHADRHPDRVTTLVAEGIDSQYVQLFRFESQERLVLLSEVIGAGLHRYDEASLTGIIGRAALTGSTVYVPDVHADTAYIAAEKSTSSELAIPIRDRNAGQVVAVLNLESPLMQAFGVLQIRWLEGLSQSLGRAFSRMRKPEAAGTVTCHFLAEMDDEVVAGETISVDVTLSREDIESVKAIAAVGREEVPVDRKLIVELIPLRNFVAVSDTRLVVDLPDPGDPTPCVFDVKVADPGDGEILVRIRRGAQPLVRLQLRPRIAAARTKRPTVRRTPGGPVFEAAPGPDPKHELSIFALERGGQRIYQYNLRSPDLKVLGSWESKPFTGSQEEFIKGVYQDIEDRYLVNQTDAEQFQQELRQVGAALWDELIPEGLQEVLWKNRVPIDSILVMVEEPFIPWELIHLKQPKKGLGPETRFFGQMGLVRWLHNIGWPPTDLHMREGRCRYVIPRYPHPDYELPSVEADAEFLEKKFKATPIDPHAGPVRKVLETPGSFDLLHFACHGVAEFQDIHRAELLLEGRVDGANYVTEKLRASVIEQMSGMVGEEGVQPIVMLNASQASRAGYKMSSLGGFSRAFLHAGAGLFAAPLWAVGDSPGRHFFETFYDRLLRGETVAEATVAAREDARQAREPNWIAYTVYGNPHARLARGETISQSTPD